MSKYQNFFVNLVTNFAIALAINLSIVFPALAVNQELHFYTDKGYAIEATFSYDDTQHPKIIHEQGKGKTEIVDSMQVSFYKPTGELIASYDNIINGVAQGNYFEFNFEPATQQLFGNIDLGGESNGEMYLKGKVGEALSLIEVELSGQEKAIDIVENDNS